MANALARSREGDLVLRSGPLQFEYETIADRIAADGHAEVLDWGCGWGQITDLMLRRGVGVTAFEYDETVSAPTVAPLERFPQIEAHRSNDPVALPFPDDSFDAALSCGVLEHVMDPDGSLDELRRVLRPGGTLYVYKLPNTASYLEWIARRIGIYHHGVHEFDKLYTLRSGRAIIERHGFRVDEQQYANMLPLSLQGKLAHRFDRAMWRANVAIAKVPLVNRLSTNVEYVATSTK